MSEGLGRSLSIALQGGIKAKEMIKTLEGIRGKNVNFNYGNPIYSVPDGVAHAMKHYSKFLKEGDKENGKGKKEESPKD